MFEKLSEKLTNVFGKLARRGRIHESDLKEALKEVKIALLEADVNFKVVRDFLDSVTRKALGQNILKSLTPAQQVIKVVNDELVALMGGAHEGFDFKGRHPLTIMMVGLQGSGKTTTSAKLALWLKKQGKRPYLVPADATRPAAINQLILLADSAGVPRYPSEAGQNPVEICERALEAAKTENADVVIVDTAGRLTIDEDLMRELSAIKGKTKASEILLVADAMTGQDAVTTAKDFNDRLDLTGVILSKTEGDARGGAAMSIRAVTGKPLRFVGTGEKPEALEPFHPERAASLILGMGDVLTLIEKAQETVDREQSEAMAAKMQAGNFTLSDFRDQLDQLAKIGTVESILGMIPGLGKLKKLKDATPRPEKITAIKAIIDSMTKQERENHLIIDHSRKKRIAGGSGTSIAEVNSLLKSFAEMRKMLKSISKTGFSPDAIKRMFG
ncbi:MAG: signal recognition particle protein [Deltaproteobacteria bacterium]|jgi:signal recognition particle subunit SRP54|nr:signal recognition particle protein [Deltaproteobacteria bacterium]